MRKETRGRGRQSRAWGLASAWVLSEGFSEAVTPAGREGAGLGRGWGRAAFRGGEHGAVVKGVGVPEQV